MIEILSYCICCGGRWKSLGKILKYGKHYKAFSVKQIQQNGSVIIKNYDAEDEIVAAICSDCLKDVYYEDFSGLIKAYVEDGFGPTDIVYKNKEPRFFCSMCSWEENTQRLLDTGCHKHSPLTQLSGQHLVIPDDLFDVFEFAYAQKITRIQKRSLKRQHRSETLVNMWKLNKNKKEL